MWSRRRSMSFHELVDLVRDPAILSLTWTSWNKGILD